MPPLTTEPMTASPPPPGFERSGSAVRFADETSRLILTVCTSRIVRVELVEEGQAPAPSYVGERAWPPCPFEIGPGDPVTVSTADLAVEVRTRPLRLSFLGSDGEWLLREPADGGARGEAGAGRRLQAGFEFSGEQHFYGLGQGGPGFDRLGASRQLWNSHLGHGPGSDMGVPLLLSNRGYAVFFDNTADAALAVGRSDGGTRIAYTAEAGRLVYYVLLARDMRALMRDVADLLGRPSMPPRWALGFLQSTRHFRDTEELRQLPRTIREKQIPCDGLIYLSSYGEALGWNRGVGHLQFQPDLWRDPRALIDEARAQHFEITTHEYPVLHESSPLFGEAEARGFLLTEGYARAGGPNRGSANYREGQRFLDFTNPATGAWWWSAHRDLVALGVAGWWLDGGEGPPAGTTLHGGDGTRMHNIYDRFRHQAFAEGEARDRPDQRVFLLCRSGAAGMQRFGSTCWSGDINNDFPTLEAQIPLGLNTGLSGVPYWGTDVGGFFHAVPETGELYARWFQLGAFSPIFRSHGWVWREHVPWAHGAEIEGICRRYAELRYRLLPYTYTLAWQAHAEGLPLMRPLVLNYPDDPRAWTLGHAYLWGDDLLVAPVTREGATAWPVYLPSGGWHDFWTGARYEGPAGVTLEAPLERLPLLVRAGAIIPMGPVVQWNGERPLDEITLLVYPEGASRFTLYEDDGRTNAYRRGVHALTRFTCDTAPGAVTLRIAEPEGHRSVVPADRRYLLRMRMDPPISVTVDGHGTLPRHTGPDRKGPGWWLEEPGFVAVRLPMQLASTATLTLPSPSARERGSTG